MKCFLCAGKYQKKLAELNKEMEFYNKQALLAAAKDIPDRSFANKVAEIKALIEELKR
jgi:hypothetical protein